MAEINWNALRTPDFAGDAIAAGQQGRNDGLSLAKQNALRQYSTDPDGGIRALMAVDPATAVALQKAQAEQQQQASQVQAGQAAASGDLEGAARIAGGAGNFELMSQIQGMSKEQRAQASAAYGELASTAQSVKSRPYEERKAAIQAQAPRLLALGLKPEQLANFDPTDQNIDSAVDDALGVKGQIDRANKARDDAAPKYTTLKDGPVERLVQTNPQADGATYVPGQGWTGGAPQPASQPGTASPAAAPAPDASAPIGLRNNNPLNLRPLGQGQWNGQTGVDGGYASFATPQDGWNAAHRNLQTYATAHGINTIQGVISRWAPQGDGANDPGAYAATVAKAVGVDPNAPLDFTNPQVREKVLSAMAQVELGRPYTPPTQGGAPQGQQPAPQPPQSAPQAPAAQPPAGQPGVAAGWQPRTVMTGQAGQWQPDGHGALVNAATGDRKKDPTFAAPPVAADPNVVKMVLDGRYPVPTGRAATSPEWQAVVEAASAQDPTFSATNYPTRVATRLDFARGKAAATKTALNTAIGHAGDLYEQIGRLHDTPIPAVNYLKNGVASVLGQDAGLKSFNLTKDALMHEALKVFSGSTGALHEFTQLASNLNYNDNPVTQKAVVNKLVSLMASKMDALAEQYKNGMGREADGVEFLSPKAQKVFAKLTGADVPPVSDLGSLGATAGGKSPAAGATDAISSARSAIAKGADRNAVIQRLRQHGIDPSGL